MEVLVRVGSQKSFIKFNNIRAYRALSLSDVPILLSKIDTLDMLIFEDVQPDEIEGVRELADNFTGKVYTFGSIQLAGIKNFVSLSDLQDEIESEYSIEAKTYNSVRLPDIYPVVYTETGEVYTGDLLLESKEVLGLETSDEAVGKDYDKDTLDRVTLVHTAIDEIQMLEELLDTTPATVDEANGTDGVDEANGVNGVNEPAEPDDLIDIFGSTEYEDVDFGGLAATVQLGTESGLVKEDESTVEKVEEISETIEPNISETIEPIETIEPNISEPIEPIETIEPNISETTETGTESGVIDSNSSTEPIETETIETGTESGEIDSNISEPIETGTESGVIDSNETSETSETEPIETGAESVGLVVASTGKEIINSETIESGVVETLETLVGQEETAAITREELFKEVLIDRERIREFKLGEKDEKILDTVVSELNFYRDMVSKLVKAPVTDNLIKLESDYSERVSDLQTKLTKKGLELDKKQSELVNLVNSLDNLREESEEKLKLLQKEGDARLQEYISEQETVLGDKKVLTEALELKEKELSEAQLEVTELTVQVKEQSESLVGLRASYMEQMDILGRVSKMYADLKETTELHSSQNEQLMGMYNRSLSEKSELQEELTNMELQLKLSERKINEVTRGQELKLADFEQSALEMSDKLKVALAESQRLGLELVDLREREASATRQKAQIMEKLDGVLGELEAKESSLTAKDAIISNLEVQIGTIKRDNENANEYHEQAGIADLAAQELQKQIGHLQMEAREVEILLRDKDKRIGGLIKSNDELKKSNQALSRAVQSGSKFEIAAHYGGRGFIIPVFGSGSFGITTSAVSLANTLHAKGNNVLLMDLDLVSPKCHSFYKECTPLFSKEIGATTEIKNQMYHSCMGVLMQRDTSHFIQERGKYIQNAILDKKTGKRLDLFTGLFEDVEIYKFSAVSWDELLGTLGNEYDYLILDLGRLGGSDATNALIKMFAGMSLRYLAVTTKRDDDIRNLLIKMKGCSLSTQKLVWMLNLADNTSVSKFMERCLAGIDYRIVTMVAGMYGTSGMFTDNFFKGKFNAVVDLLTLETVTRNSLNL